MRGGTTSTSRIMNASMDTQKILIVGLPMAIAIMTREVDNEMTMAMAKRMCKVGFVEILKTNFMPEAQEMVGGVNASIDGGQVCGVRKGIQE